ncbi:hypothetical protein POVCU2_0004350 [Plasmodium ovale curtisi]|uniref:Uncharacterized protein n=1 Tax=Plasmodium ovale curtisi TaxID=864141 RepID=A0A1A8VN93_PLAOA|nr:hypothetical protein POVCU2_0004350 [Plasmodium ovale curtisi]SBS80942.1 hypothetical protein POVCU1_003820 [Plasmodium ovale curtisi]
MSNTGSYGKKGEHPNAQKNGDTMKNYCPFLTSSEGSFNDTQHTYTYLTIKNREILLNKKGQRYCAINREHLFVVTTEHNSFLHQENANIVSCEKVLTIKRKEQFYFLRKNIYFINDTKSDTKLIKKQK